MNTNLPFVLQGGEWRITQTAPGWRELPSALALGQCNGRSGLFLRPNF